MAENSYIEIKDDAIAIGFPFEKVDIKNRTVEGFATLDNVDKTGEIVDFEASRKAFSDWAGNIREMHGPKAVGKALLFEERPFQKNGKDHNGIWVKAYISKGANDTWEKVLDGTLQGFSIGGHVQEKRPEVVKNDGPYSQRHVVRITKYVLGELSVVDNPANPLALFEGEGVNKASLLKYINGTMEATDIVADELNVYYCNNCDVAKAVPSGGPDSSCVICDNDMLMIGTAYEMPDRETVVKMVREHGSTSTDSDSDTGELKKSTEVFENIMNTKEDEKVEEVVKTESTNLQLNGENDTKILTLLNQLLDIATKRAESETAVESQNTPSQGGEIAELDKENLSSILDILKTAFASVEEVINKWSVTPLNSENATDVEVAKPASLPGSGNNPQLQIPGSNGADMGLPSPSPDNVTPHSEMLGKSEEASDETTEEETTLEDKVEKAEESDTLTKAVLTDEVGKVTSKIEESFGKVSDKFTEIEERISKLEGSGAIKKSGEVNDTEDLKKSDNNTNSFWSGTFSPTPYNG